MRVLHLLTSGDMGGIEVLCRDIGNYASFSNTFCFLFKEGVICDNMKEDGLDVVSLTQYRKYSIRRIFTLYRLLKGYNIVIVHHDDPNLEIIYCLMKAFAPSLKYISMIHHCYDPERDEKYYNKLKLIIRNSLLRIMFNVSDKVIFVSNAGYRSYEKTFNFNKRNTTYFIVPLTETLNQNSKSSIQNLSSKSPNLLKVFIGIKTPGAAM